MIAVAAIMLASLLSCLGQLSQKQATSSPGKLTRQQHLALWLGLAIILMGLSMLVWLLVLRHVPVSIAYPMLSLNFVWITLAARWIWHETVPARHWFGVALIISGIVLLSGVF